MFSQQWLIFPLSGWLPRAFWRCHCSYIFSCGIVRYHPGVARPDINTIFYSQRAVAEKKWTHTGCGRRVLLFPEVRLSSSRSRSASTAAWSGSRGACSSGCYRSAPPRTVRRSLLSSADPVREHRPAEAASAAVDRGRGCGDQRAGFALGAIDR